MLPPRGVYFTAFDTRFVRRARSRRDRCSRSNVLGIFVVSSSSAASAAAVPTPPRAGAASAAEVRWLGIDVRSLPSCPAASEQQLVDEPDELARRLVDRAEALCRRAVEHRSGARSMSPAASRIIDSGVRISCEMLPKNRSRAPWPPEAVHRAGELVARLAQLGGALIDEPLEVRLVVGELGARVLEILVPIEQRLVSRLELACCSAGRERPGDRAPDPEKNGSASGTTIWKRPPRGIGVSVTLFWVVRTAVGLPPCCPRQ